MSRGGLCLGEYLSGGVSVQGVSVRGVLCQGDPPLPYGYMRVVCILLECILVLTIKIHLDISSLGLSIKVIRSLGQVQMHKMSYFT